MTPAEARRLVAINGTAADYDGVVRLFLKNSLASVAGELGYTPEKLMSRLIEANAQRNIEPILDRARELPFRNPLRQAVDQFDMDVATTEKSSEAHEMINSFPNDHSEALNSPSNAYGRAIEMMLSEDTTRRELMKIIDDLAKASTKYSLDEIDEASLRGERVVRGVVIIGGGPQTAILASILAPFRKVTLITREQRLGEPMRSRPIFLNSTVDEDDPTGRQLPFSGGSTTPTRPRGMLNQPSIGDALVDKAAKSVICDDLSEREYISAKRLGEGTAAVVACNTHDIITGQEVIPNGLSEDGTELYLIDPSTSESRYLYARTVIFLGGPGTETSTFEDKSSNRLYGEAGDEIDSQLESLREFADRGQADRFQFKLPRVLSLSGISKLLSAWEMYLDRDPNKYPLVDLLGEKRVAVIGAGDTGRTIIEFLAGNAPQESYPEDFEDEYPGMPMVTWYGQPLKAAIQYRLGVRRRYKNVWNDTNTERIRADTDRASTIEYANEEGRDGITVTSSGGIRTTYDYVISASGFIPEPKSAFGELKDIYDTEGYLVGKMGSSGEYLTGSFANIPKDRLPAGFQRIIDELGISENTIAMWVYAALTQRLGWTIASFNEPESDFIEEAASLK